MDVSDEGGRDILASYGRREWMVGGAVMLVGMAASLVWFIYAAPVFAAGLLFLIYFFRDPSRAISGKDNELLAPADGRVLAVEEVQGAAYLSEPSVRITIFLSLFDCHINRAPCAGRVEYLNYRKGRFHPAWQRAASSENERNAVGIGSAGRFDRVLVRQVAGIVARRIVCQPEMGDPVTRGQKIGMIKFGSRTELLVPKRTGFRPCVSPGDRVKAGVSVVGEIPPAGPAEDPAEGPH